MSFGFKFVAFLGHVESKGKIITEPTKIEVVRSWARRNYETNHVAQIDLQEIFSKYFKNISF